jgi:hypothetical protein
MLFNIYLKISSNHTGIPPERSFEETNIPPVTVWNNFVPCACSAHLRMSSMNFSFLSLNFGSCVVKLWATGRYGFSQPKKVEISTPGGETCTFLYYNRKVGLKAELANRTLVRIAITQFLASERGPATAFEIDDSLPPFSGTLTPIRPPSPPPPPPRVRPGRPRASATAARQPRACETT